MSNRSSGTARRCRGSEPGAQRAARAAVEDEEVVLAAALRFLETRPRSVDETRRRLIRAGYQPALVESSIERLHALGILDDETFARAWIESRDRAMPRGVHALRHELALKGVDHALVERLLEERDRAERGAGGAESRSVAESPSADEAAAARLLERRRSTLERIADPRVRRGRAYALLARSGFDHETSATVVGRFLAAREMESEYGV